MIDANKLSQLQHLKHEIELLNKQIEDMDCTIASDSVKGSGTSFPYVEHRIVITGVDLQGYEKKLNSLKRRLSKRIDELMDMVTEINEFIEDIGDSEMRQILTLRYVNGFTWQQVAAYLGYQDESAPRKKHDRFMK